MNKSVTCKNCNRQVEMTSSFKQECKRKRAFVCPHCYNRASLSDNISIDEGFNSLDAIILYSIMSDSGSSYSSGSYDSGSSYDSSSSSYDSGSSSGSDSGGGGGGGGGD